MNDTAAEAIRPEIVDRLRRRMREHWLGNLLKFAELPEDAAPTLAEVQAAVAAEWHAPLVLAPPKRRPSKRAADLMIMIETAAADRPPIVNGAQGRVRRRR